MKFGRLLDRATALGFDAVATGHHARVARDGDRAAPGSRGAPTGAKDQSYVLYMLGRDELARTLLPVGELTKAEVRAHAARLGLRTAAKPESMDVCFITRGGADAFLGARIAGARPARSSTTDGTVRRRARRDRPVHDRAAPRARRRARRAPLRRRHRRRRGDRHHRDARRPAARRGGGARLVVRRRRRARARRDVARAGARARRSRSPAELDGDVVRFARPQPRVAPGQVVALYDGDVLLGGGIAA